MADLIESTDVGPVLIKNKLFGIAKTIKSKFRMDRICILKRTRP